MNYAVLNVEFAGRSVKLLEGRTAKTDIVNEHGEIVVKLGKKIAAEHAELIGFSRLRDIDFSEKAKYIEQMETVYGRYDKQSRLISRKI